MNDVSRKQGNLLHTLEENDKVYLKNLKIKYMNRI